MSPSIFIWLSATVLLITGVISSVVGVYAPILLLSENQILYLYSTSAQVIAGVYGLTLTGFIFFRNELSREEFEDETLIQAVENLKERYFRILLFVTTLSIVTLIMANLTISSKIEGGESLTTILMNITQSSFVLNLLVIAYFIFDVIAPKRIELASKKIQRLVDPVVPGGLIGSLEEFLMNYNNLESILQKYGEAYQSEFEGASGRRRRLSNVKLAEFILRAEKIDYELFKKIKNLITLRNSIIHGADPKVSASMVNTSKSVLTELAQALGVGI